MCFENYDGDFDTLNLDFIAMEHIKTFCSMYNIQFPYDIHHKAQHLAIIKAYFGKANYVLQTYDIKTKVWSKEVFKIRGQKQFFKDDINPNFTFQINNLNGVDEIPNKQEYYNESILRMGTWRVKLKNDSSFNIRPGDIICNQRHLRLKNSHMPIFHE